MKKSRYTKEQVTYALRLTESGTPVADVCRQVGIAAATFHLWKKKFGSLGLTEVRELRQMREENARLKRLVADLTLDKQILQEVLTKTLRPVRRRELARWIHDRYQVSCRRRVHSPTSVRIAGITDRRPATRPRCACASAKSRPRFGYIRTWIMLRRESWRDNKKRMHRLYRLEVQGRMRVRRQKRRCLARGLVPPRRRAVGIGRGAWIASTTNWSRAGRFAS